MIFCERVKGTMRIQNEISQALAGIIVLTVAFCFPSRAQVINGDFSSSTNHWRYVFPASNRLIPDYGIMQIDIDGTGPLSNSPAFYANVGEDALLNLEQDVYLSGGVTYKLWADLASVPYGLTGDGGVVSVYVGSALIASYSFGAFYSIIPQYANLSGSYVPSTSGTQTLSIHFSRAWGFGGVGNTPTDVIDNFTLDPISVPLGIQLSSDMAVLTWTNSAYTLQSAPSVTGVYTSILGASSPYTNAISEPARYFRLIAN